MAYVGQGIKGGTFSVLDTSGNTYNGSNTTFNLGTQVGSPAQLLVSHDGVIQKPVTDYTIATGGTQITFTTAPASGASIFITEISGAVGAPMNRDINGDELILDADADTSITADTDDQIDIRVAGTDQITIKDGALSPVTDNDIDLGTSSLEFKDGYFDGTLHCDVIDLAGTEYTSIASTMNALTDVSMDITNFTNGLLIQTNSDGSAPTTGTLSSALANIGIGTDVFQALTSGDYNVAIGNESMDAHTEGSHNVAIGHATLSASTTADDNIAIGRSAGAAITTGGINILIGKNAGDGFDAEQKNIGIGNAALGGSIAGAEYCIALGHEAGQVITSGDNNTLIGYQAGESISTGENNVCMGNYAGNVLTTGSNNICIGYEADTSANDISHGITLGYNMTSSSNVFAFGKSGDVVSNTFSSNANWSRSSDIRKKREIYDQGLGLDFINDLRTVNFQWKPQNEFPKEWNDYSETSSNDTEVVMHGFIAQEVKEALDKHASKRDSVFAGWSEGEDGMQHTSREMFVIPLIKAVQELSAEVKELKAKLEDK
jgi:hypothetical protein